jgi:hypothetical protein
VVACPHSHAPAHICLHLSSSVCTLICVHPHVFVQACICLCMPSFTLPCVCSCIHQFTHSPFAICHVCSCLLAPSTPTHVHLRSFAPACLFMLSTPLSLPFALIQLACTCHACVSVCACLHLHCRSPSVNLRRSRVFGLVYMFTYFVSLRWI